MRLEADANAANARTEAAKSEQVARFMEDMLTGVGPSGALGRDTTMLSEILDATAKRLDAELSGQPEVATDLRETLALVYRDLGRFTEADALLARVVESRRAINGEGSAKLATSLNNHGTVLARLGRDDEANTRLESALVIRTSLFGAESPEAADTLFELAQVFVPDRGLEVPADA
jgi:tetratricopeptide (TPR) repeat protein